MKSLVREGATIMGIGTSDGKGGGGSRNPRRLIFLILGFFLIAFQAGAGEVYRWKDEQGRTHYTNDITRVPPAHRKNLNHDSGSKERKVFSSSRKKARFPKSEGLAWPIQCIPGQSCSLGYPDVDGDGKTGYGEKPGYRGHEGTDIIVSWEQMDRGVEVYAAAEGIVQFVFDDPNRFDRCQPKERHPDCRFPDGTNVTTGSGPYCRTGGEHNGECSWVFGGGNVVVILHPQLENVFATRYDHLKSGSVRVKPGQKVRKGQTIAKVGSAGKTTGPHLHFEVWGPGGYYTFGPVVDPWDGAGVPGNPGSLWAHVPPWKN